MDTETELVKPRPWRMIAVPVAIVALVAVLGLGLAAWQLGQTEENGQVNTWLYACFQHSFGKSCEFRAWDAGKKCHYNSECGKNLCLYDFDREEMDRALEAASQNRKKPREDRQDFNALFQELVTFPPTGRCDAFQGDNDGQFNCSRKNANSPIECGSSTS